VNAVLQLYNVLEVDTMVKIQ